MTCHVMSCHVMSCHVMSCHDNQQSHISPKTTILKCCNPQAWVQVRDVWWQIF